MIWNVYFSSCFSTLSIVLDYLLYWISYWKEEGCRFDCCRFWCSQLLYYYYNSCRTIIITIGWSICITCPFHCLLIYFDTGTAPMSSLLLLLIFYNLIYYYYYFKSTNHSDSTLSLSVIVDWDIPLSFEPINCSINTKFHIANTDWLNSIHDNNTIIIIDYFKLLPFALYVNRKKIKAKGTLEYWLLNRTDIDMVKIFVLAIYLPLLSMAGLSLILLLWLSVIFTTFCLVWFKELKNEVEAQIKINILKNLLFCLDHWTDSIILTWLAWLNLTCFAGSMLAAKTKNKLWRSWSVLIPYSAH